jgi:hypothetical protein
MTSYRNPPGINDPSSDTFFHCSPCSICIQISELKVVHRDLEAALYLSQHDLLAPTICSRHHQLKSVCISQLTHKLRDECIVWFLITLEVEATKI